MGYLTLSGTPVEDMSDAEIVLWLRQALDGVMQLRKASARLWTGILRVLDRQGPPMTVRGIFYGCEILGLVPKTEDGYRRVAYAVLVMRRVGILPYDFIADAARTRFKPHSYSGLRSFLQRSAEAYRRALWDNLPVYVEIWCEKDALRGVLLPITDAWDVPLFPLHGFCSETHLFNAAQEIQATGKPCHIYYFGDLDPSGWLISQHAEEKLREFGVRNLHFERLAVHPWQVEEWDLPTRPPKSGDTRARNWPYPCVEVDAIPADMLRTLCETAITQHIPRRELEVLLAIEREEREVLQRIAREVELWRT
ncbi:MAG: hypothetical protein WHX60_05860 [Armatimonadota bacterium]